MAIARHIERHRARWRSTELVLQGVLVLILAAMLVYAAIMVIHGDMTQCEKLTTGSRTGLLLAGLAFAGFGGGRILGYIRKLIHEAPPRVGASRTRPAGLVQGFLLLFLIGTTLLLGYETYAVFQPSGNPPAITTYVRCAAAAGGWIAGLAATLIGLLLGSWLWYPTEEKPWQGFREMVSRLGFGILVGSTLGALLIVAVTEFILIARGKKPLGHFVNEFMVHYPWFAGVLAIVFGAMIAHFFLHITHG